MGGVNNMGGTASPTQATQGTGMQPGGFDLSKLFMGNQATNQPGGGMQLPQIMAPARQPMPTMPQRTPMPLPQMPQAAAPMSADNRLFAKMKAYREGDNYGNPDVVRVNYRSHSGGPGGR